ncbi:type II secretion system F family protein [Frankia sp. Cj3]|uniref:type II secretion system F family protein n=1 Tax=Frankia sp. Cj3 TaxID=2880976 RepID=UPI001EF59776|nr:hypothetical protein [Frankia sp. Cj3]
MTTIGVGLCGAMVGLAVWLLVAAASGRIALPGLLHPGDALGPRHLLAITSACGLLVAVVVQIPVLGVLTGGLLWIGLTAITGPSVAAITRMGDAVASWCETVRQELEAGQPLRAAVVASCDMPPEPLAIPLGRLAERLERQQLPDALWGLRADVDHAAIGPIIAALDIAYRRGAGDLPRLMANQVEATRHRVAMLRDLHASRAKHRRAMALLLALFAVSIAVLMVVWPAFLAAYRPLVGELVLGGIGGAVFLAVRSLVRLSQPSLPPDFFAVRDAASTQTARAARTRQPR